MKSWAWAMRAARSMSACGTWPRSSYITTLLAGTRTRFLPFNQGKFGGAGNPPVPPTRNGYATGYLWEETWARDSVLDLVRQFIHEVEEEDDRGRKTGARHLISRVRRARRAQRDPAPRRLCHAAAPTAPTHRR